MATRLSSLCAAATRQPLPDRPLVELAVAEDHEDAVLPAADLDVQGHADGDGEQVPERPGVELDPRDGPVRVPVDLVVRLEVVPSRRSAHDVAELGERAVERRHVVALREEEVVPIGIFAVAGLTLSTLV